MRVRLAALLGIAALLSISCGGITDPSKNVQDQWQGTLPVGQVAVRTFNVSNTGELSVVINAMSPISNGVLAVLWGTSNSDGSCNTGLGSGIGGVNSVVLSSEIVPGNYCLAAYDYLGNLTVSENFTITISHP